MTNRVVSEAVVVDHGVSVDVDHGLRVYCDYGHMNHRVKAQRFDYQGTAKVRFNCRYCHYDYQRQEPKWLEAAEKLLAAGVTSISLRNLERYG